MLVEFFALWPDGTIRCPLPEIESWSLSPVANDAGALQLTYSTDGINFGVLREMVTQDRDVTVAVWVDGVARPELLATLSECSGDDVAEGSVWQFTGTLAPGRLEEAIVQPKAGQPAQGEDPTTEQQGHFYSATAGTIVSTLLVEAQGRGALSGVTYSFTGTLDTAGAAWSKILTIKLTPGTTYLQVLKALVEAGLCEFRMHGLNLRMYEPGTIGTDRTLTSPPVVFRRGQSISDAPRKYTTREAGTAALVAGGDGFHEWVTDAAAQTRFGRRIEIGTSQGSITDEGTLEAFSQHFLSGRVNGRQQVTHGLTMADGPVPIQSFEVGDWAWSDLGNGLERYRVAQWVLSMSADGTMTGTVTLNDLLAERDAALAERLRGIQGGTTIAGTSNARPIPTELIDGVAPNSPSGAGISISSVAYITDESLVLAAVTITWDAVLLNENGTALTDLSYYSVFWRYQNPSMHSGNPLLAWTLGAQTGELFAHISGVRPGEWIDVRVGATDAASNFSGWSSTVSHQTANDTAAPPTPSALVATAFIGAIKWEWNGLGALGEAMPGDFNSARIHISTVNGFTPTAANLYDTLPGPGAVAFTNAAYGTTYYGRIVLVDTSGNTSAAGAISSTAPRQVLNPDVAALSIGSAQIIDLDVGKVTAGTLNANVILGGSIATASSGARFGMNSAEFYAYKSDGTKTVSITNAGAASFLGEIRTAATAARMVINPGGTAPSEMRLYPANNSLGKYVSLFTADVPGYPGYSLAYLRGDRGAGLSGESVLRMWWYEASLGWFNADAGILEDEESAVYARQYSAGINGSATLFTAHGLRSAPVHEFAFAFTDVTRGMGRMFRDSLDAFVIGCPAKGTAIAFQGSMIYAVAEGNTLNHVGFTALTLTQSSGVESKTNVTDIEDDVLDILDRSPSKRWEYKQDHQPRATPEPIRRRKRNLGRGAEPDDVIEFEVEGDPRPIQRHYGPMVEDLPDGVRVEDPRNPSVPLMDHGSMIGLSWEVMRRLHDKIKTLERRMDRVT